MKIQSINGFRATVEADPETRETVFVGAEGKIDGHEFRVAAKSGEEAVKAFTAWAKAQK